MKTARGLILQKKVGEPVIGYTTGSCAAAAAGAAARMLFGEAAVEHMALMTPAGIALYVEIEEIRRGEDAVSCGVRKDAGADSDVTDGVLVRATVRRLAGEEIPAGERVRILGGEGVGRVTKPGLDQPVGEAAINRVPREMIRQAVCGALPAGERVSVEISIPGGEALAAKTFNPKLGIAGGLSVLGTSGIVRPMSEEAIRETIRAEISVRRAAGDAVLVMAPGNYGMAFLTKEFGISADETVMISNFVRDAVDMAREAGFHRILLAGHVGKLVKVAAGMENTHSRYGDHRMETLAEIAREQGADALLADGLRACVSTDEAVRLLEERGMAQRVLDETAKRVAAQLCRWADGTLTARVVLFSIQEQAARYLIGSAGEGI